MAKPSFIAELRRRHVVRVGFAYVVTAWLLIQLGAILLPTFGAPHWVLKALVGVLILLFPVALLLAWAFEMTPEGVRRTVSADAEQARPPEQRRRVGQVLNISIIVVLAAAVGVLAWRQFGTRPEAQAAHVAVVGTAGAPAAASAPAQATVIPAKSIAVLPFENLSSDKNNAYFAEGMQDLILTKLADIGDLKVISRTSTMQYGSHPENLQKVGEQLGVATLLEGSVQRIGNQVLVNVQLIDARSDSHIWAQSYQRTLDNVFGVEGEVAAKIAATLDAKLSPAESKRLATALSGDPEANDLYLRAEYFVNRANSTGRVAQFLKQAIALYRQALVRAPNFALAHAGLSRAESTLAASAWSFGVGEDLQQLTADAYAQAEKAMKLAPNLAESHLAIGYYEYLGKGDYEAALEAFTAALKIRPNDADAYAAQGNVLFSQGNFNEAIDAFKHALTLNPRSVTVLNRLASTYTATNRYSEAEQVLQQAIALDPGNESAQSDYALSILLRTGDASRALSALQGNGALIKETRVYVLGFQHKYGAAIALVKGIPDTSLKGNVMYLGSKNLLLGDLYRWSGDRVRARRYYAKALPGLRAQLPALAAQPEAAAIAWLVIADAELGLGKTDAGIAAIKAVLAAGEKVWDQADRAQIVLNAAYLYAQADRADEAVSLLSQALNTPGLGVWYSPVLLWLDPEWDPIRKTPEFQALLKKYAKYEPATVPAGGSAPAAATAPTP